VASTAHFFPFQASASVELPTTPTAVQALAETHETPPSSHCFEVAAEVALANSGRERAPATSSADTLAVQDLRMWCLRSGLAAPCETHAARKKHRAVAPRTPVSERSSPGCSRSVLHDQEGRKILRAIYLRGRSMSMVVCSP
jgi:hypothetical protein